MGVENITNVTSSAEAFSETALQIFTWALPVMIGLIILSTVINALRGLRNSGLTRSKEEEDEEEEEEEEEDEDDERYCEDCGEEIEDDIYECTYCHREFCEDCITKKVRSDQELYLCKKCLKTFGNKQKKKKKPDLSDYRKKVKPINPKDFE